MTRISAAIAPGLLRLAPACAVLMLTVPALAGSHLWRFNEFFSTADGIAQYIEMVEIGGSDDEFHLNGKTLHSNGNTYVFPANLPPMTANRNFLVATESYTQLVGVPAPDYVIPDQFFDPAGDTVQLHTYDLYTFAPDTLPTNGYHAFDRMTEQVITNSPTNFNFDTAQLDLSEDVDGDGLGRFTDNCTFIANTSQLDTDADQIGNACDADIASPNDCLVNFFDLELYKTNFFSAGFTDTDNNGDGLTNFADLNIVKGYFFGPPGPSANGCN